MGKITGKKQKTNVRPILYVAAVAIPAILIFTILVWPKPPIALTFIQGPDCNPHVSKSGMVLITWQTNEPARATVYYQFKPADIYDEIPARLDRKGAVAIPAAVGQTLMFYVKAETGRRLGTVQSKVQTVRLQPAAMTQPAAPAAKEQK